MTYSLFRKLSQLVRTQQIIIEKLNSVTLYNHHNGNSRFSIPVNIGINAVCLCVCVYIYVFPSRHLLHVSRMSLMKPQVPHRGEKTSLAFPPSLAVCVSLSLLCS